MKKIIIFLIMLLIVTTSFAKGAFTYERWSELPEDFKMTYYFGYVNGLIGGYANATLVFGYILLNEGVITTKNFEKITTKFHDESLEMVENSLFSKVRDNPKKIFKIIDEVYQNEKYKDFEVTEILRYCGAASNKKELYEILDKNLEVLEMLD
ncbi:hypothetical protein ACFL56_01475 [Candidatus Margulisiibacteriota bacterium]